ncbi:phytanoyl-CoA dioxygenase family protein [Candidatus Poribacteria bacterium]|nr:phytanoyl-CoA dioxygenase family protein [Candidatus Poribacteria bacterium]MBT5532640.1 phytanoyl-CoA dioxygenase family protein [Candidatus Poribacteria bacterium]MBT5713734.1 phytanoyl-CoA dioxygenase family protein [Candidatus Poribacteria bacterium]MBT7805105.1 phytanoyl-CoA dioxygenase family protein [Candidatus Poribacteria bacterium]
MLSDKQLAQYHADGYVRLGKVATDEEFDALRQRTDDITQGRVQHDGMWFQLDLGGAEYKLGPGGKFAGPSDDYRKIEGWERDPVYLAYTQHPVFQAVTRQLIGERVSAYRCMFMNKPPRKGTVLPYHQDGGDGWGLSSVDGADYATIWTALDPATKANGCVEVVPGSHTLGLLSKRGHVVSEEDKREHVENHPSVFLELDVGEVVVLHNFLLHRSGVNESDIARRGYSVCYMDGAIHRTADEDRKTFPMIFGDDALSVLDAEARMSA